MIVLVQVSVIFLVDMRRVVETGMIGIHTPSSGQIIISCRSIVLFAKSSATKFVSIFPLHSIFFKIPFLYSELTLMIKKSCTLQLLHKDSGIGHISKVTIYGEIPITHLLITRCVHLSTNTDYHFQNRIIFQLLCNTMINFI